MTWKRTIIDMGKDKTGVKLIANNKKAYHDFFIEEKYEAGIELYGTEIKSLRQGKCSIKESYVGIENGEAFIYGMHIPPYEKGFGDYLELAIESDGTLPEWQELPDYSDFLVRGREPGPVMSYKWNHAATAYYDILSYKPDKEEVIWLVQRLMEKYGLSGEEVC